MYARPVLGRMECRVEVLHGRLQSAILSQQRPDTL
jgi:hypothetical protein